MKTATGNPGLDIDIDFDLNSAMIIPIINTKSPFYFKEVGSFPGSIPPGDITKLSRAKRSPRKSSALKKSLRVIMLYRNLERKPINPLEVNIPNLDWKWL